ncbi:hypothetical protein HQ560_02140, partial [bacterium]|nr:hypothetical protein [bacterium]
AGGCCGGGTRTGSGLYYVAAVKDCSGAKSVEVLEYKKYKEREKTLKEDYITAYKEWKKDKTLAKPSRPGIAQVQKFKGKEGKAQAGVLAARLQKKLDAKDRSAQDKKLAKLDKEDASSDE